MDVRTICLGILTRGDATGYEIKKLFEDGRFHSFVEASYGSIYPALSRLTEDGLIEIRAATGSGRADRKVYAVTPKGRAVFIDSLNRALPEDRFRSPFLFAMLFADLMPPVRTDALIVSYIADVEAKLAALTYSGEHACNEREAFVCGFGRSVYEAILNYLKEHRNAFNTDATCVAAE